MMKNLFHLIFASSDCDHDRSKVFRSDHLTVGILKMSMAQLILDASNLPAGCNGNMEIKHMIDGA